VAAENGEAQLSEFLRGVANSGENDFRFAGTGIATGDDKDTNCGSGGNVGGMAEVLLRRNGNREIGADGNEMKGSTS